MVMAGALGNIIDCVFYGKIWGYAGWFHGRVVDMLYFPLIRNAAGECVFFQPSSIISTVSSVTRESAESIGTSYKTIFARIGDLKLGGTTEDESLNQIFPKKK